MGYGIWDMGYGIGDWGYGIWDMGWGPNWLYGGNKSAKFKYLQLEVHY